MPRGRPLTQAERKEAAEKQQRERVIRIINAAMEAHGLDRQQLSREAAIDYQVFNRRMRGESDFRLPEISGIANALSLDAITRAAICGSAVRCRFEPGYRPDRM